MKGLNVVNTRGSREVWWAIAIIAVVAVIAMPIGRRRNARQDLESCEKNLKNLSVAMAIYSTDNLGR